MRMTIKELAKDMQASEEFCRICIQLGKWPFATGVKMSSVWTYHIEKERYEAWKRGELV